MLRFLSKNNFVNAMLNNVLENTKILVLNILNLASSQIKYTAACHNGHRGCGFQTLIRISDHMLLLGTFICYFQVLCSAYIPVLQQSATKHGHCWNPFWQHGMCCKKTHTSGTGKPGRLGVATVTREHLWCS